MTGGRREWAHGTREVRDALSTAERSVRARFYAARCAAAAAHGCAKPRIPAGLYLATSANSRTLTPLGKRLVELRAAHADEQVADAVIDGVAADLRRLKTVLWHSPAARPHAVTPHAA